MEQITCVSLKIERLFGSLRLHLTPGCVVCQLVTTRFRPLLLVALGSELTLYGRLLINQATWQVGGFGFGQMLIKRIFFSEHSAQCHRLWYNVNGGMCK